MKEFYLTCIYCGKNQVEDCGCEPKDDEEFDLSSKIFCDCNSNNPECVINESDVKEFIRLLDSYCDLIRDGTHNIEVEEKVLWIQEKINKLAGEDLI